MTSPKSTTLFGLTTLSIAALSVSALVGCGGETEVAENVAAPAPAPAPTAPAKPRLTPVSELMQQMHIDERIAISEEAAPDNDIERKAVLTFFDAFARGDADSVASMLTPVDQAELQAMVESGRWDDSGEEIDAIELRTGKSPTGDACVLAVFHTGFDYQPQLWYYRASESEAEFEAVAAPPDVLNKLHGDWIAVWHELLEEEMELANKPEHEYEIPPTVLASNSGGKSDSSAGGGGGGTAPAAAPGGGGKRPRPPKRRAPGRLD